MTDETMRREDEEHVPAEGEAHVEGAAGETPPEGMEEADRAETEEAEAAADEEYGRVEEDAGFPDEEAMAAQAEAAMADAQQSSLRARASWSLLHKEMLVLLFANCLFFAGVFAAWTRAAPGEAGDPAAYLHGLDTIRGAFIFTLALYGFWIVALNIWFRQVTIWPFLINALLALWVGIPGFTRTIGSERWEQAQRHLDQMETKSFLDKAMVPLSSVPPYAWLLTAGGAIVLVVLLKGVMSGASKTKARASGARSHRRG